MAAATTLPGFLSLIQTFRSDGKVSGPELSDLYQTVYNLLQASDLDSVTTDWDNATTYDTPATSKTSGNPAFAISSNRYWKSKTDGNVNHQPPSDPGTTEDSYWIEVSASSGALEEWAAGTYGAGLIIVFHNDQFYKLTVATRPYESSNIDTEITSGDWTPVGQAVTGLLENLTTTDKTNLVAAINELKALIDADPAIHATYSTIATLTADQTNQEEGQVFEVTDASSDSTVVSGKAWYKLGASKTAALSDYTKISEEEAFSENILSQVLQKSNNLSDVANAATARNNLDVYGKSETYTKTETDNLIDWDQDATFTGSSGDEIQNDASSDISGQTGSAKFTFLDIDVTQSGRTSTGESNFINYKKGGVSQFRASTDGDIFVKDQGFFGGATSSPASTFYVVIPDLGKIGGAAQSNTFIRPGNTLFIEANSNISLTFRDNFLLNSSSDGGGDGVCTLGDRVAAPSSNPSGGYIWWSESGSGKARTPSGNIVTYIPNSPQAGYTTFTNLTTSRTGDADSGTLAELWDIVGTLIEDFKTLGFIKA